MTAINYLIVENNIVINNCVWNGDTSIWTPPEGSIQLIQETTSSIIWQPVWSEGVDPVVIDWVLSEVIGQGGIGFTWDGTVLTTNQPKP